MDVVDRIVAVPTTTRGPYENVPASPGGDQDGRVEGAVAGRPAQRPQRLTTPRPRQSVPSPSPSPTPQS